MKRDNNNIIYQCSDCSDFYRFSLSGMPYCKREEREIKYTYEIPDWCPLADAKNNTKPA